MPLNMDYTIVRSSLADHPYLSTLLTFVLAIFLTKAFSTTNFHSATKAPEHGKSQREPPIAPYWIPGIYHAISFGTDGPAKLFSKIVSKYSSRTPFLVMAGPAKFAILNDAAHLKKVFSSKSMSMKPMIHQLFEKAFGSPKRALDFYAEDQSRHEVEKRIDYPHVTLPRKYFSGAHLSAMSERYLMTLRRNLRAVMAEREIDEGGWLQVPDLLAFFQDLITRTTMESLLGSVIVERYPQIVPDFWEFDSNLEMFMGGTPRFMARSAYEARDRLLQRLKDWDAQIQEDEGALEDEADWNKWGSAFIRARHRAYLGMEQMDADARASELLAIIQGSNSNLLPSIFWLMFDVLRDAGLKNRVQEQIDINITQASTTSKGNLDVAKLAADPFLQSMYAEVTRLRMATATARTSVVDDFPLDSRYRLSKNTNVMIFALPIALNHELWAKARPEAVARPLNEFWAERFLTADGRFSVEGVSACWVTFGGGSHLCPGRHFARNIALSTAGTLLGEYEIELTDPEGAGKLVPEFEEMAYGLLRPTGSAPVRLRKRVN